MANVDTIGELDVLVTVQSAILTIGEQGQKKTIYTTIGKYYAKVEQDINEMVINDNFASQNVLKLTMYKIPAMTTRWRVIINDIVYQVQAIDPISRTSRLQIVSVFSIDS